MSDVEMVPTVDGFKIKAIHAYIAIDPADGDEGIMAFRLPDGGWMPIIAADAHRLEELRPLAEQQAVILGVEVRLVRFDNRTTVEILNPERAKALTKEQS